MRGAAPMRVMVGASVLLLLGGCGRPETTATTVTAQLPSVPAPASPPPVPPIPAPAPPPPLVGSALSLTAPPLEVPLRFRAPTVGIDAPVLAVGRTPAGAMDAPEGPAASPNWQQSFWYRGGSEPGRQGTATIAGHVDDVLGRPAAFWNIRQLKAGDIVEVDDQRTGGHSRYRITDASVYSFAQANSPDLLQRLYGDAAYNGDTSQRNLAADAVSRISIITCTGTFHRGSSFGYDHRFIAFGVLVPDDLGPAATIPASDLHLF
ncbi:MAG TPA: class F sortase [Candidatus Dormibacteraeota bacterium]